TKGLVMSGEAQHYQKYARECARQAAAAQSEEHRRRLTDLAQVWFEAALIEEATARGWLRPGPDVALRTGRGTSPETDRPCAGLVRSGVDRGSHCPRLAPPRS